MNGGDTGVKKQYVALTERQIEYIERRRRKAGVPWAAMLRRVIDERIAMDEEMRVDKEETK